MKESFIGEIDAALESLGYSERAKFIRDAIREKLGREGVQVPALEVLPPGSRRKSSYQPATAGAGVLNDQVNSGKESREAVLLRASGPKGGGSRRKSK